AGRVPGLAAGRRHPARAVLRGEVERDLVPARVRAAVRAWGPRGPGGGGGGGPRPGVGTALRGLPGAVGSFGVAPVVAYLLTWSGWFLGENSYDRHWADAHSGYSTWLPGAVRS